MQSVYFWGMCIEQVHRNTWCLIIFTVSYELLNDISSCSLLSSWWSKHYVRGEMRTYVWPSVSNVPDFRGNPEPEWETSQDKQQRRSRDFNISVARLSWRLTFLSVVIFSWHEAEVYQLLKNCSGSAVAAERRARLTWFPERFILSMNLCSRKIKKYPHWAVCDFPYLLRTKGKCLWSGTCKKVSNFL